MAENKEDKKPRETKKAHQSTSYSDAQRVRNSDRKRKTYLSHLRKKLRHLEVHGRPSARVQSEISRCESRK